MECDCRVFFGQINHCLTRFPHFQVDNSCFSSQSRPVGISTSQSLSGVRCRRSVFASRRDLGFYVPPPPVKLEKILGSPSDSTYAKYKVHSSCDSCCLQAHSQTSIYLPLSLSSLLCFSSSSPASCPCRSLSFCNSLSTFEFSWSNHFYYTPEFPDSQTTFFNLNFLLHWYSI